MAGGRTGERRVEGIASVSRKRVLLIISGFAIEGPLGGVERFGVTLAQQLHGGAYEPVVCGLWEYGVPFEQDWRDALLDKGVHAFMAGRWNEKAVYRSFRQAVAGIVRMVQEPVDIIHSHSQFGDVAALLLRRRLGASALMRTVHNEREWPRRPWRRLLLTNLLCPIFFQAEAGVAEKVRANLDHRPLARFLGRKAHLIHNSLDLARFEGVAADRPALRAALGLPPDALVVGAVGRFYRQKGQDVLIAAIPEVLARLPQARFVLVGDGEERQALERQAAALGIGDRISFAGRRRDVEALFQCFDLFVNPARWEGLPTVLLESMAARVPVVATDVSGTRELIEQDVSGKIVPSEESGKLAQAIVELLTAPAEIKAAMTQKAYATVRSHFSIAAIGGQYCQLYDLLLEK
jgi:glycosyltransferase involved in cell wall biosynthesis